MRTVVAIYTALVADVPTNVRGTTLTNSATVKWNDTNGADPTSAGATFIRTSPGATATVTVQEPLLTVAKVGRRHDTRARPAVHLHGHRVQLARPRT